MGHSLSFSVTFDFGLNSLLLITKGGQKAHHKWFLPTYLFLKVEWLLLQARLSSKLLLGNHLFTFPIACILEASGETWGAEVGMMRLMDEHSNPSCGAGTCLFEV